MIAAGASVAMIRVIGQNTVGAIELLGEQHPHHGVWQREPGQGPFEIGPTQYFRSESVGAA